MLSTFSPILTNAYAVARRTGFLNTETGKSLFTSAYFAYKRWIEDPFAGLIRRYPQLFHRGDILDIGANIGYCSLLFAQAIDKDRKVFAFEPEPFNLNLLRRVMGTRASERVIVVPAAVGDHEGEVSLQLNPRHHGDHRVVKAGEKRSTGDVITVPLISIDGYLKERNLQTPVCLLKVDVQGYEMAICEGAQQTLERNPACRLVVEYMPSAMELLGYAPEDFIAWFDKRGYDCYLINRRGGLKRGLPPNLRPGGYIDLLFSRTGIE